MFSVCYLFKVSLFSRWIRNPHIVPLVLLRLEEAQKSFKLVMWGLVHNPVRVQSMTTTDTLDIQATVNQTLQLAEAGCEIVRITAPNVRAAEALNEIAKRVRDAKIVSSSGRGYHYAQCSHGSCEVGGKVRVNPGNYADQKISIERVFRF